MKRYLVNLLLAATAIVLSACGGGGGGGTSPTTTGGSQTPPPSVAITQTNPLAAWKDLWSGTKSWSVTAQSNHATTHKLDYYTVVNPSTSDFSFNPVDFLPIKHKIVTATFNGQNTITLSNKFLLNPDLSINTIFFTGPSCAMPAQTTLPPTTANINSTGMLYSTTIATGCPSFYVSEPIPYFRRDLQASDPIDGNVVATWSFESDQGVPLFCINTVVNIIKSNLQTKESICVEVSATGSTGSKARMSISTPENPYPNVLTLSGKNY